MPADHFLLQHVHLPTYSRRRRILPVPYFNIEKWHVQVIARVAHLTALNASAITPYERKESELRYMRAILGALLDLISITLSWLPCSLLSSSFLD